MAVKTCIKPPMSIIPVSGSICSFNALQNLPLKSHEVDIDYTGNAISGVNVYARGINLWDEQTQGGYYNASGVYVPNNDELCFKNRVPVLPNTTYYLGTYPFATTVTSIIYYKQDGTTLTRKYVNRGTFTTPAEAYYMVLNFGRPYGTTYNNDVCINYPSTDTDYHAFVGQSFNITFPTPIYGGSYDCLTGIVTSDKDSGGGDITPTYQQTATANCLTLLGENNIWADAGNTNLSWIKIGR